MHEFEKVVLINTDVQIMQSGVDRLFDFPLKTFDIAMAPNGGTEDLCTVDWQEGVSHAGYSNSGVLVLRPSNSLYHMTDMFTRCIDYDQPLDEQLVLNAPCSLLRRRRCCGSCGASIASLLCSIASRALPGHASIAIGLKCLFGTLLVIANHCCMV